MKYKRTVLAADFETTVFEGQKDTLVWASALVELGKEEVTILGSIEDTFEYLKSLKTNVLLYYHNLKFDGSFWLDFLMKKLHLTQAFDEYALERGVFRFVKDKWMRSRTFKYVISDTGQWYGIKIKLGKYMIELRDSLKLLPFSIERIGKQFGTLHKKLKMKYEGFRYPNCYISPEEKEYIRNDVLVLKEALEIMYEQGHNRLTIGSCCLNEFKEILAEEMNLKWDKVFPNHYDIELDPDIHGVTNADDFVRRSYRGGWCHYVKEKAGRMLGHGVTADVNSLYPSVMHSMSDNWYPVYEPHFWIGDIPEEATKPARYYFIRFKCRFYLKDGYLPFIQQKHSFMYNGNENLTTSDVYDAETDTYMAEWTDKSGKVHDTAMELTMTQDDWELFQEHYRTENLEVLGGCWYYALKGIFDIYIDKYKEIKMKSKGAVRELAKLFLNNLYGKLAASRNSSFKVAYLDEEGNIKFRLQADDQKAPGYIPIGSAITSKARCFTIRAAQKNYHGPNKPGFCYADTDSIHCDLREEDLVGINVHPTEFNHWKVESYWDKALFIRQKTYYEHVTHEDGEPVGNPYDNLKCAGLPEHCKQLFLARVNGSTKNLDLSELDATEKKFLFDKKGNIKPLKITDFKVGIEIPGKLKPQRIDGGVLLVKGPYKMH